MKKLFVMTLAVAALASCSKVETIEPGYKSAIGFGKSFVDNTTKALIEDADDLENENFAVWGTEKQGDYDAVAIFAAEEITWNDTESAWEYDGPVRYWHEGHVFNFAAVAPFSANTTVGSIGTNLLPDTATYTLAPQLANQVDLLYAKSASITPGDNYNTSVKFTFDHMLAKVKFIIENTYTTGYTVDIEGLQIKAAETATVTFADKTWASHADTVVLPFTISTIATNDTEESNESLIIPNAAPSYKVSGTAKVKMGSTVVKTIPLNYTITSALKAGYHYNITALIEPSNPIQFDVTGINGFTPDSDIDIN